MTNTDRVEYLKAFPAISYPGADYALFSALVSCLAPAETIQVLDLAFEQDRYKRRAILRKLCDDLERGEEPCHKNLVDVLLKMLDSLRGTKRASCAAVLDRLQDHLSNEDSDRVIKSFLQSPQRIIRRRAYRRLRRTWQPGLMEPVAEAWRRHGDNECAAVIIAHFPIDFVVEHFDELTRDSRWAGRWKAFLRLRDLAPDRLQTLKQQDEIGYVYVCLRLGRFVDSAEAVRIYERNRHSDNVDLLFWCFGKMGLWDVLVQITQSLKGDPAWPILSGGTRTG